jgi:hypothetical protein
MNEVESLKEGLAVISDIASRFADGHDEINEYTPDAY